MWFKVDDALAFHMKVVTAGNTAMGLWVRAGSWSAQQLSDGFVPANIVRTFGGTDEDVRALCNAQLWHEVENGYQFHDWDEYQPTRDKVLSERAKARHRMSDLRKRSPEHTPNTDGTSDPVRLPRPDPSRSSSRTSSRRKPSRPLPDDWRPNAKHQEAADEKGVDLSDQSHRFRGDALAKDKRYVNWDQAFHNWLTKAVDFGQVRPAARQGSALPTVAEERRKREEREARERGESA